MIHKITQRQADAHRGVIYYRSDQHLKVHVELGVSVDIVVQPDTTADVYHDGLGSIYHKKGAQGNQEHRGEGSCLHKGEGIISRVRGVYAMHHGTFPRKITTIGN